MPVLIGGAFAAQMLPEGGAFPTGLFLLTLLGVMMLHLTSNVFNDYFDWKRGTDQVNSTYFLKYSGGSRAIELGLIDLAGTWRLAWGLLSVAVLIGVFLTWQVGTGVLLLGLTGAALGFFYTAPPVRLVARHGLGELAIGLAFGPLITLGTAYVATGGFDLGWPAFLVGIPVGLLTANILVINQIPDVEADASTGKNHLVVTFGTRRTPYVYGGILGLALVVHLWLAATTPEATWLWWLPGVLLAGYGTYIIQYMVRHLEQRTLVHANVQTIQLNLVYGLLFAGVIVFG
jgi:1,4-dihydroxy-2-naphthoate octaprenyltransferase